jgi:hypothetical protein
VDDDAGLEARAAAVAQLFQPSPVLVADSGCGLDLDGGDLAGTILDDEVDVFLLA